MSTPATNGTPRSIDQTLQDIMEQRLERQRNDLLAAVREELREHREVFAKAVLDEMAPYLRAFQESRQLVESVTKQVEAFVAKPIQVQTQVATDKLAKVLREQAGEGEEAVRLLAAAIEKLAAKEFVVNVQSPIVTLTPPMAKKVTFSNGLTAEVETLPAVPNLVER